MPRVSRHTSSKHSSKDARDFSDSEKDSSSKDRKSKEESSTRVSKESGSGEKRKLDAKDDKDSFGSGNGEYIEEYSSSSKRRKERVEDGSVNDRWNGGDDDRGEGTKKLKEKSGESKSKRRDESAGAYGESQEVVKKNSGKSEGKHRDSSGRKKGREDGAERERDREKEREKDRDRRGKEGKTDKLVYSEEPRAAKQVSEKSEFNARDLLQSPGTENFPDRRLRKKRDGSCDGDKHQDDTGDVNDRRLSSREDIVKDGRPKDEKHKDERSRDKYREDGDRENRGRDEKQRDDRAAKDNLNSRSDDKHLRDDKDTVELRPKKYKPQDGDCDREREHDHDHDCDFELGRDHDRGSYQCDLDWDREHDGDRDRDRDLERDRNRDRSRDRDHDHDWERNRDRERERDRDRDREHDRDRERDCEYDRNLDYDVGHNDDRIARYKDSRGRKISPDDYDDYIEAKTRGIKTPLDMERKSCRAESDTNRGRSQSRQAHLNNNTSSSRRRASPNTSSHGAGDDYRQSKQEELKYRDAVIEQRSKSISSREVNSLPGGSDRASKYRSNEKPMKVDDANIGELSLERSSSSKASPMGLVDRSPSSTSLERRYMNRSGVRRSLDIEELGRRSSASMGARDLPSADDRANRDLPLEKILADESTSVDSSFYNRNSQSNSALIPPSAFRGGVGSPSFLGSLEEDSRLNTSARYKRGSDPNMGRQGNAWRGASNWPSPMPNGYIPFQHGLPHGGFQAIMPQFPSPRLFGVRPSMEIGHSGIPYHIPDADRFSSHLRPLGWQAMMDGSGHSHIHGWDGNNGVFRDDSHIYGAPEWDQNRHLMNGRGWESSADIWKGQNGDANMDLPSTSLKEDFPMQSPVEDVSAGQEGQRSLNESNHLMVQAKRVETKLAVASSAKESSEYTPKTTQEKTTGPPKLSSNDDNIPNLYGVYLSKLDISTELTDPELYSQFLSLLNVDQSATIDEDPSMLVNLKDGARAVPKSSVTLLSSSLFPATSDSVFQRAMDIYKRQRVGLGGLPSANGGTIDVMSASGNDVDTGEEPVLNYKAETSEVQLLDLDEKNVAVVPIAAEQEKSEGTTSQELDGDPHRPDLKSELPGQALSHGMPEKPMMIFNGDKVDGSKLLNLEDAQGDFVSTPDDVPNASTLSPTDEHNLDEIGKKKGSNSFNCAEEGQGFGDRICGPLIFSDGSPKASEALMPGPNESESVILSRIHHSPESTH